LVNSGSPVNDKIATALVTISGTSIYVSLESVSYFEEKTYITYIATMDC